MGRDKHEPKDSKQKFQISDDAEKTLIGLMLVIISLIGLLNRGFVGEFLTYIFVYRLWLMLKQKAKWRLKSSN